MLILKNQTDDFFLLPHELKLCSYLKTQHRCIYTPPFLLTSQERILHNLVVHKHYGVLAVFSACFGDMVKTRNQR